MLPKQYFLRVSGSMNLGSHDLTISSCFSPGSLISHLPLRPQIAGPHSLLILQDVRHLAAEAPPLHSPPLPSYSPPSSRRGRCLLGYFYPRSFLKEKAAWPLSQKHETVSLWKTSSHGEGIQGIFFLGPGLEPSIFLCPSLIYQGFSR